MKKILTGRIFALFILLCVLCTGISVSAAPEESTGPKGGVIAIDTDSELEGVHLGLYTLGTYVGEHNFVLLDKYKSFETQFAEMETASDVESLTEAILPVAEQSAAEYIAVLNEEGKADFYDVDVNNNVFLVVQTSGYDEYTVTPFIVVLPAEKDGTEARKITINAKYIKKEFPVPVGAVILTKVDKKGKIIAGAEFTFEAKTYLYGETTTEEKTFTDDKGTYYWKTIAKELVSNKYGQVTATELPYGIYRFVETSAPDGYEMNEEPLEFEIKQNGSIRLDMGKYIRYKGTPVELEFVNEPIEMSIIDPSIPESSTPSVVSVPSVPEPSNPPVITGEDIAKFIIIGVVVAVSLVAVILLFVLGKKKKNDD